MLRTDFVELINSGAAWAFVGSGPSIASGYPKWRQLVTDTVAALDTDIQTVVQGDYAYVAALAKDDYSECFGRIEHLAGRKLLDEGVRRQLVVAKQPGRITRLLTDWPFVGYVTTNYDVLLEQALEKNEPLGWLSVGNTRQECRKLAGEPKGLVWHIHGSVALSGDRSELVLTNSDYDNYYLEDSEMVQQLRSLLLQRRVVFIGFGFQDPDVSRLLRLVGRWGNPARPAYALLAGVSGMEYRDQRKQLLEKYNVDVIPYRVDNGSHADLLETLETYGALILKR